MYVQRITMPCLQVHARRDTCHRLWTRGAKTHRGARCRFREESAVCVYSCMLISVYACSMRVCTRFAWRSRCLIIPNRGSSKYKYTLSSRGARHGTLRRQWSYGPARCTIQVYAVPLTQTAVRDCNQELEAMSSAAIHGSTFTIHPDFMPPSQHYIGTVRHKQSWVNIHTHTHANTSLIRKGTTTQLLP
jgi:hypothetical protein